MLFTSNHENIMKSPRRQTLVLLSYNLIVFQEAFNLKNSFVVCFNFILLMFVYFVFLKDCEPIIKIYMCK